MNGPTDWSAVIGTFHSSRRVRQRCQPDNGTMDTGEQLAGEQNGQSVGNAANKRAGDGRRDDSGV